MITEFSQIVCVPELEILEGGRKVSELRQLYWYILYQNGFGYSEIGRLCEKHHATVLFGVNRIVGLLSVKDLKVTALYEKVKHIKR
jgi:hypothetical protein